MKNEEKYEELKQFFLQNFETTSNINDRLHTQDIYFIVMNDKFSFSSGKIAEVFKSLNIGEHRRSCNINRKIQSGYYYVIYKGA
jgi:hypothetical protein